MELLWWQGIIKKELQMSIMCCVEPFSGLHAMFLQFYLSDLPLNDLVLILSDLYES